MGVFPAPLEGAVPSAPDAFGRGLSRIGANSLGNVPHQFIRPGSQGSHEPYRHAAVVPKHSDENVFGPYIAMLHHRRLGHRHFHGFLGPRGEILRRQPGVLSAGFTFNNFLLVRRGGDAPGAHNRGGHSGSLLKQPQHDVLRADIGMPQSLSRFNSQVQSRIGFFRKAFKTIHKNLHSAARAAAQIVMKFPRVSQRETQRFPKGNARFHRGNARFHRGNTRFPEGNARFPKGTQGFPKGTRGFRRERAVSQRKRAVSQREQKWGGAIFKENLGVKRLCLDTSEAYLSR